MMSNEGNDSQAWVLTLASALACIFGSFFICIDLLIRLIPRYKDFDLQKDKRFLVGGLSLGAGVLLFTALNKILPEGLEYLQTEDGKGNKIFSNKSYAAATLMTAFVGGVVLCIALNALLHRLTPQSVIHCGDEEEHATGGGEEEEEEGQGATSDEEDRPAHSQRYPSTSSATNATRQSGSESTPLIPRSLKRSKSRSAAFLSACKHPSTSSTCAGFTDPCKQEDICCTHKMKPSDDSQSYAARVGHSSEHGDHHHHVTKERDDLLRVGIQTAIAISLHKLPEGFIMFMTSHRDSSLGFSIFLALAIHNVVEGFTISFPLFLAFGSRTKAIAAAVALGGLSQPLGAALAWALTRTKFARGDSPRIDLGYGILFGATAGFMSVIAISALIPQAIRNDSRDGFLFTTFFFIGTIIIGFSSALTGE